jgi:hypothetical protein
MFGLQAWFALIAQSDAPLKQKGRQKQASITEQARGGSASQCLKRRLLVCRVADF